MALKEEILKDLTEAVKSKEELKSSVLRMLSAAILNKEKEKRYKLGEEKDVRLADEEIADVISSEAKKRREAAIEYEKAGRSEMAEKEKQETEILKKYLPEQLSEEEVRGLVKEAIEKTGAAGQKDMGKVMAALMPKVKGRADGALVSQLVKDLLTS
ncbi:MAG: GatB/YqeY domain-containing protein [Candidatus Nealsonbacteria bacterium]|nr:GatB/YqeY domain-containing protein [Candidatus Nealsonbacteria bacterium]